MRTERTFKLLFFAIVFKFIFFDAPTAKADPVPNANTHNEHFVLLGDTHSMSPTFIHQVNSFIRSLDNQSTVLFLGNITYGSYDIRDNERLPDQPRAQLLKHKQILNDFQGQYYFVLGESDWNLNGVQHYQYVKLEYEAIEDMFGKEHLQPNERGCPGPAELHPSDHTTLIALNTPWWFVDENRPVTWLECDDSSPGTHLAEFKHIVERYKSQHVLVFGHHSFYSSGPRMGEFGWLDHIFPLRHKIPYLGWTPLPIIGSLYPLYRQTMGGSQDLSHPTYRNFRNSYIQRLREAPHAIYASAHEHTLEYIQNDMQHYIVSGTASVSENDIVTKNGEFLSTLPGFSMITLSPDGSATVEFFTVSDDLGVQRTWSKLIYKKNFNSVPPPILPLAQKKITVSANKNFDAGALRSWFVGTNHRDLWTAKITFPVLDLKERGLSVTKRGGSGQSLSLTLEGAKDRKYALRSVNKVSRQALPKEYHGTLVEALLNDLYTAMNPYGALVAAKLEDEMNLFHTNPEIYYVPQDERLGVFKEEVDEGLYLLEEKNYFTRPNVPQGVDVSKAYDTQEVEKYLRENQNAGIEVSELLQSRLLDILIGDWDRHEGNWKWVKGEVKNKVIFYPVPVDRDQAFFDCNGTACWWLKQKWAKRNWQTYTKNIRDPLSLAVHSDHFDRLFFTGLDWDYWRKTVKLVQAKLTDEAINRSFEAFPAELPAESINQMKTVFKYRLSHLEETAKGIYASQSEAVNILGTHECDVFEAYARYNGSLRLVRKSCNDNTVLYERVFYPSETKELRLYGLQGEDKFNIGGVVQNGMKIRVLGGKGKDTLRDLYDSNLAKSTYVYDEPGDITIESKDKIHNRLRHDDSVYHLGTKDHRLDKNIPLLFFGRNVNDGFFYGAGVATKRYTFGTPGYSQEYFLKGNYSFDTSAGNVVAGATFVDLISELDFKTSLTTGLPQFRGNFFGLGNNLSRSSVQPDSYYWIKPYNLNWTGAFLTEITKKTAMEFGAILDWTKFTGSIHADTFINAPTIYDQLTTLNRDSPNSLYSHNVYLGPTLRLAYTDLESVYGRYPTRGIQISNLNQLLLGLNSSDGTVWKTNNEIQLFGTLYSIRTTLRLAAQYRVVGGQWEFYQAEFLGNDSGLRSMRSNSYAGEQAFVHQIDLMTHYGKVFRLGFPFHLGTNLFFDQGRVWYSKENSDDWHRGYGFGAWIYMSPLISFETNYSFPETSFTDGIFNFSVSFRG